MKKSSLILGPGEFLGMEYHSGYKRYYVFGTNPADMFKRVIQMYNSYAGNKYNKKQFTDICKEEGHSCFLYKFNIGSVFSFHFFSTCEEEIGFTDTTTTFDGYQTILPVDLIH